MGIYDYGGKVPQEDENARIRLNIPKEYEKLFPKGFELTPSLGYMRKYVSKCEEEATEIAKKCKTIDDRIIPLKKYITLEGYEWMVRYFEAVQEMYLTETNIKKNIVGKHLPDSVVSKLALDKLYIADKLERLPDFIEVIDKKEDEDLYIYRKMCDIPQIVDCGLTLENLTEGFQLRGVDSTGEFNELKELNSKLTYEMSLLSRDVILYLYEDVKEVNPVLEVLKQFADSTDEYGFPYTLSSLISGYFEDLCEDKNIDYKKAIIYENPLGKYIKILD